MSRFYIPKKYGIRPMRGKKSKLLAFFNIVDTEIGIQFNDMRLMKGKDGVFVGSMSKKFETKDGEEKYTNAIEAAYNVKDKARDENGVAYFEEIAQTALKALKAISGRDEEEDDDDDRPARKSGRGLVAKKRPTVDEEDEEEDDTEEEEERPSTRKKTTSKYPFKDE